MRSELQPKQPLPEQYPVISQNIKHFVEYFKKIDHTSHKLNLMSILAPTTSIIHLDQYHCIIQTKKYQHFIAEIGEIKNMYQAIEQKLYSVLLQNAEKDKSKQITSQIINKYKLNQCQLMQSYKSLKHNFEAIEKILENKDKEIYKLKEELSDKFMNKQPRLSIQSMPLKKSIEVQTFLETKLVEINHQENNIHKKSSFIQQTANKNLDEQLFLEKMEQNLQNYCTSIENLRQQIRIELFKSIKFEEENFQLKQKNKQLEDRLIQINIEDQKLRFWKQKLGAVVENIEKNILKNASSDKLINDMNEQQNVGGLNDQIERLNARIISLQMRNIQLKKKFRSIENLMSGQEEVGDEGPVGNLVKLTQRIKCLVKGILIQI